MDNHSSPVALFSNFKSGIDTFVGFALWDALAEKLAEADAPQAREELTRGLTRAGRVLASREINAEDAMKFLSDERIPRPAKKDHVKSLAFTAPWELLLPVLCSPDLPLELFRAGVDQLVLLQAEREIRYLARHAPSRRRHLADSVLGDARPMLSPHSRIKDYLHQLKHGEAVSPEERTAACKSLRTLAIQNDWEALAALREKLEGPDRKQAHAALRLCARLLPNRGDIRLQAPPFLKDKRIGRKSKAVLLRSMADRGQYVEMKEILCLKGIGDKTFDTGLAILVSHKANDAVLYLKAHATPASHREQADSRLFDSAPLYVVGYAHHASNNGKERDKDTDSKQFTEASLAISKYLHFNRPSNGFVQNEPRVPKPQRHPRYGQRQPVGA